MPSGCPECCRALKEIEHKIVQIEEITSRYLPGSEQLEAVEEVVKRIIKVSREARAAECRED